MTGRVKTHARMQTSVGAPTSLREFLRAESVQSSSGNQAVGNYLARADALDGPEATRAVWVRLKYSAGVTFS